MRYNFVLYILLLLIPMVMVGQNQQTVVILKNGSVLKGVLQHIDPTKELTINISGIETVIQMGDVASVETEKSNDKPSGNTEVMNEKVIVPDTLENFKGFLLAKGNNVFVFSEDIDYEKAGADLLRNYLMHDGFWNVVDRMQDAHFIISYYVQLLGFDKGIISVSSWRTHKSEQLYITGSNESPSTNRAVANDGYKKIVSLQKKIESGKVPKSIKDKFTIE